jgi:hypothetical protein
MLPRPTNATFVTDAATDPPGSASDADEDKGEVRAGCCRARTLHATPLIDDDDDDDDGRANLGCEFKQ